MISEEFDVDDILIEPSSRSLGMIIWLLPINLIVLPSNVSSPILFAEIETILKICAKPIQPIYHPEPINIIKYTHPN